MKELKAWVARDEDGMLYLYAAKPQKLDDTWYSRSFCFFKLDDSLFPEVKWSDEEPKGIELSIHNKEESKNKIRTEFLL